MAGGPGSLASTGHRAVDRPGRPGGRPCGIAPQACRRSQGVGVPDPRPRRHPGQDRLVPVRQPGAGRLCAAGGRRRHVTGVVVLGSTGSIGRQALEVLSTHPDRFSVVGLASATHAGDLLQQAFDWPEARVWLADGRPDDLPESRWAAGGLEDLGTPAGASAVLVATTGMAARPAVLAALAAGGKVALANKETLVTGGHLVAAALDEAGGDALDRLRPVDSEHSAIWQCLLGERI